MKCICNITDASPDVVKPLLAEDLGLGYDVLYIEDGEFRSIVEEPDEER